MTRASLMKIKCRADHTNPYRCEVHGSSWPTGWRECRAAEEWRKRYPEARYMPGETRYPPEPAR